MTFSRTLGIFIASAITFFLVTVSWGAVGAPVTVLVTASPSPAVTEAATTEPSPSPTPTPTATPTATPRPTATPSTSPTVAPTSLQFISQAPLGQWDPLHDDACEEASLLMVEVGRSGKRFASMAAADEVLKDLVHTGEDMGHKPSITLAQLNDLSQAYYGYQGEVRSTVTREALRADLDAGALIIIPAAGRELGNPYFTPPGPVYHMLVVHGYDAGSDEFITHDPGTKHGANYRYSSTTLINAIHDYDAGENITAGTPRYLKYSF